MDFDNITKDVYASRRRAQVRPSSSRRRGVIHSPPTLPPSFIRCAFGRSLFHGSSLLLTFVYSCNPRRRRAPGVLGSGGVGEYEEGGVVSRPSSGSPLMLPDLVAARERVGDSGKAFGTRGRRFAKEGSEVGDGEATRKVAVFVLFASRGACARSVQHVLVEST